MDTKTLLCGFIPYGIAGRKRFTASFPIIRGTSLLKESFRRIEPWRFSVPVGCTDVRITAPLIEYATPAEKPI